MEIRSVPIPLNIFEIADLELCVNYTMHNGAISVEHGKELICKLNKGAEIVTKRRNRTLKFT